MKTILKANITLIFSLFFLFIAIVNVNTQENSQSNVLNKGVSGRAGGGGGSFHSKDFINNIGRTAESQSNEMVPNVVVIKFKDGLHIENNKIQTGNSELDDLLTKYSVISLQPVLKDNRITKSNVNSYDLSNIYFASFSGDQSPAEVAANLETSPHIEYAEPKYIHYIAAIPNDSLYHLQQSYYDIIKAPQAWDLVKGEEGNAIIAIVDGGTDIRHPDLADNIWSNETELNGIEGIDDDDNGYIDDLYGWNFATESGDPTGLETTPFNANHGTLTAGVVSAISNNLTGVAGVSWNASVMAINASSESNDREIHHGFNGIIYAANNGADVISISWGGYDYPSSYEEDIIKFANSLGAVVIAAAGNDRTKEPFYPASYYNVLSVAGTDIQDNKWVNSNYGPDVDLCAPADSIFSTSTPENGNYGFASGTSLSTPLVAGLAGLVKAQNPGMTGLQAGEQIRMTADSLNEYSGQMGRGRINAYRALTENPPSIRFLGYDFVDENNNGLVETGERIQLRVQIINYLAPATNITLTLSASSDYVTFVHDQIILSSIGTLEQISLSESFVFDVDDNTPDNHLIELNFQIKADGYEEQDRFTFERVIIPDIWTKYVNNPVLTGGESGTWDKLILWPNVLYNLDSSRYEMWFTAGVNRRPFQIGFATSPDGITWTKHPTPVLKPEPGEWDESTVEGAMVIREDGQYKMWYTGWSPYEVGRIGYATSPNGTTWTKDPGNPVMVTGSDAWEAGGTGAPHVMSIEGEYKMWYDGYTEDCSNSDIGYATSPDGITWTLDSLNSPVLSRGNTGRWDDGNIETPYVLLIDKVYHMWYTGMRPTEDPPYQGGWAFSDDGIDWTKYNNPNTTGSLYSESDPILKAGPARWDAFNVIPGSVMSEGDSLRMWYAGINQQNGNWQFGHATLDINRLKELMNPTYVERSAFVGIPNKYILSQNYPNPFNPTTVISYRLSATSSVELSIYNLIGQKVVTLVSKKQKAGDHQVEWDALGNASGIYYYKLTAGEFQDVKKMILLR